VEDRIDVYFTQRMKYGKIDTGAGAALELFHEWAAKPDKISYGS
jgi:hypothetical protein